jgi:D-beta-D-heptose 7-phosphate kinase / D-beta-D-heptose 1-phosphate adenosyltransferase
MNPLADRVEVLLALECVDGVFVFSEDDACAALSELRPGIFVKGRDYEGRSFPEADLVERLGGRVEFALLLTGRSTTSVIHRAAALV